MYHRQDESMKLFSTGLFVVPPDLELCLLGCRAMQRFVDNLNVHTPIASPLHSDTRALVTAEG